MNNLKRVLSLGLTGAMLTGMMMVGASAADFTDADEIVHTDAVNTMVALNVINGKEDGSHFDPNGSLTRAEMAKIIVYTLHGGKAPVLGTKTVPTYNDIKGTWAESYIEYCSSTGIINGRGDGSFDPTGTLTGSQAAKMLLVAMGYNTDIFGFTGPDWEINTNVQANKAGLYKELDGIDATATISRDDAAQMAFNAILANTMKETWGYNPATGTVTNNYEPNGPTLFADKFNGEKAEGVVLQGVTLQADGSYTLSLSAAPTTITKVADDYTALLGHKIDVLFDEGKTTGYQPGDKVYGVYASADNVVVEGLESAVDSVSTSAVKVDGVEYKLAATVGNITDGAWTAGAIGVTATPNSFDTFKLVDNDGDGKYDVAVVTTVAAAKVNYVSDKEIIAGGTTYKAADHNIAADLAKGDFVTIVYNVANDNYDIAKAEVVSGTVEADKSGDNLVKVNGTWYNDSLETLTLGSDYEFVAVNGVVVAGSSSSTKTANISDLVMTVVVEGGLIENKVKYIDSTGAYAVAVLDGTAPSNGQLYTIETTEKGVKFNAAALTGDYTWVVGADTQVTGSTKIDQVGGKDINDDAVVFVKTNDGATVITGKQLKTIAFTSVDDTNATPASGKLDDKTVGFYHSTVKGLPRVTHVGLTFNGDKADLGFTNSNDNYGYVVTDAYAVKIDGTEYRSYDVWTGTETATVFEKGTTARAAGDVIAYSTIADDGKISDVAAKPLTTAFADATTGADTAAIQGIEGSYIYLNGTVTANHRYKLTSDTVYMYIDSNASKAAEIGKAAGEVVLADTFADGTIYRDNVIVLASGGNVDLIIIDVKNNMTNPDNATLTATAPTITGATVELNKTTGIKVGDAIEIKVTAGASPVTGTLTATGALAEDKTNAVAVNVPANSTVVYTVFAQAAVTFTFA